MAAQSAPLTTVGGHQMRKSTTAIAVSVVVTVSALVGGTSRAGAFVPDPPSTTERACFYRYQVTDGKANNVNTYLRPRGTARGPAIRPGDDLVLYFGRHRNTPDHIGNRQLMSFVRTSGTYWVTFPRSYLVGGTTCLNAFP
jgi:hypothetical protein